MNPITLLLAGLGALLVLAGAYMSLRDWSSKRRLDQGLKPDSFEAPINAITKLIEAIKGYAPGQQMIVFGILILGLAVYFGTQSPSGSTGVAPSVPASAASASPK